MKEVGKKIVFGLAMVALSLGMIQGISTVKAESLQVSKKEMKVAVEKSLTIKSEGKAKIKVTLPKGTVSKKIDVSTDETKKIKIKKISDTSFKVTGLKKGKAIITVKSVDRPHLSEKITIKVTKKAKKNPGVRTLTMKNFEKDVVKAKGRVAIMFGTEWCHYCQLLDPIYKEAAKKTKDVKFYHVDSDKEHELNQLFGITAYPYVYLLENDKTIDVTGYNRDWTADDYVKWAKEKKQVRN